jgi:hypothetical protein
MTRHKNAMLAIGPLSANSAGQAHYIPHGHSFPQPSRVCNATMAVMTAAEVRRVMPAAPHRPGCMDAFALQSKGQSC